jgi:starch synthase
MGGKDRCKESLIEEMNLDPFLRDRPLMGMITRLDIQKGLDLLVEILDDILDLNVGLVILGSGDEHIQKAIRQAGERHPGRVGIRIGFDEALAHRIIAGSDLFLIPSRYEPCGLTQMYAMKYGTVPVVRATGGLEDTVTSFDALTGRGNGFKFGAYHPKAFYAIIRDAADLFEDARLWRQLRDNGMEEDFSWNRSARAYLEIYRSVMRQ